MKVAIAIIILIIDFLFGYFLATFFILLTYDSGNIIFKKNENDEEQWHFKLRAPVDEIKNKKYVIFKVEKEE